MPCRWRKRKKGRRHRAEKKKRATGSRMRAPRGDGARAEMRKRAPGGAAEERRHRAAYVAARRFRLKRRRLGNLMGREVGRRRASRERANLGAPPVG